MDNKIFTVSQAPNSDLLVNGMVVSQGATATQIDGHMFSIVSSHLLAGSTTVEMPSVPTPAGAMTTGVEIAGTTLSVGGPGLHTDGRTISLASDGLVLVDDQTTERFSSMPTDLPHGSSVMVAGAMTLTAAAISDMDTAIAGARYTVGSQVFSVDEDVSTPGVEIVNGSISITVGGAAQTADGHTFSAASDDVMVVDGSSVGPSATVTSEGVKSFDVSLDTQTANIVTEDSVDYTTVLEKIKKTGKKVNSGEADGVPQAV
ncbi:Cytosolic copper metallochaperone [Elasticomyces elasticus]|nr:Cytosolic copper metallochaperone [Elasticomyces elasticus]